MPISGSEALFFGAGFVAGTATAANYPKLKEKLGPMMEEAKDVMGDAYSQAARKAAETMETIQDKLAERRVHRVNGHAKAGALGADEE